jgi:hypothetical protein
VIENENRRDAAACVYFAALLESAQSALVALSDQCRMSPHLVPPHRLCVPVKHRSHCLARVTKRDKPRVRARKLRLRVVRLLPLKPLTLREVRRLDPEEPLGPPHPRKQLMLLRTCRREHDQLRRTDRLINPRDVRTTEDLLEVLPELPLQIRPPIHVEFIPNEGNRLTT